MLCGSAMRGKGIDPLLDAIIGYLPSPLDVPAVEGTVPGTDDVELREPVDSEPLSALAFKVSFRARNPLLTTAGGIPVVSPFLAEPR